MDGTSNKLLHPLVSTESFPDPVPLARRHVGGRPMKRWEVRLMTTTPVLGGCWLPRQLEVLEPIRAPSIRGHLRFWWRALHGHTCATSKELACRERELWGGVGGREATRSSVELCVRMESDPSKQSQDQGDTPPQARRAYALWIANSQKAKGVEAAPRWSSSLRFVLQFLAPADRASEVEAALRAWILWGGYGSRTRRGLGSLTVLDDVAEWLPSRPTREEWARLFPGLPLWNLSHPTQVRPVPALQGARLLYLSPGMEAEEAWETALGWLRDFRQRQEPFGRGSRKIPQRGAVGTLPDELAREFKKGRPGRSRWPESDKVRRLFPPRKGSWAHDPRLEYKKTPAWPRAGFGLPLAIRFQLFERPPPEMKQGKRYDKGEPPDVELKWLDEKGLLRERLASPLIVKAMPLANGKFVPIALWLRRAWPDKGQVVLMEKGREVRDSRAPFDRLLALEDTALYAPLLKGSLEEAFLSWVKGFQGVEEST